MSTTDDYLGLITSWHRGKPRFSATVEAVVEPVVALSDFIAGLPADFDLDLAIGAQLDVVGQWVGRTRFVDIPIVGSYFAFDDEPRGFDRGVWKGPYDTEKGITRLSDDAYRFLLRAKILANGWDGTTGGAIEAYETLADKIGNGNLLFVEDRGNKEMVVGFSGELPDVTYMSLFSGGYIPIKPATITAHYVVTSVNNTGLFGFDASNEYVAGFDNGSWGVSPQYVVDNTVPGGTLYVGTFHVLGF